MLLNLENLKELQTQFVERYWYSTIIIVLMVWCYWYGCTVLVLCIVYSTHMNVQTKVHLVFGMKEKIKAFFDQKIKTGEW